MSCHDITSERKGGEISERTSMEATHFHHLQNNTVGYLKQSHEG
jgi:hypothetical protein